MGKPVPKTQSDENRRLAFYAFTSLKRMGIEWVVEEWGWNILCPWGWEPAENGAEAARVVGDLRAYKREHGSLDITA